MSFVYYNPNPEKKTVGDFANVARTINIPIWAGCCQTVTLRNTGTQPIQARNTNIDIDIISPV